MKNIGYKKGIVFGIVVLFIGVSFSSSSWGFSINKSQTFTFNGNVLYVGGSGPGNYSKIQDAINDASNGDTIYVYEKTYYENLYVNKSITIIGQNRENTIIDGSHVDTHTIHLVTDEINISNFRFYNDVGPQWELAFYISSDNCYISDCTIYTNVKRALGIESASYNTFFNCSIHTTTEFGGSDAIRLMSDYNTFINCEIYNNRRHGALISGSHNSFLNCSVHGNRESGVRIYGNNNFFSGCNFYDNGIGFKIDESRNHQILNCIIHDNRYDGIRLWQFHPKNVTIRNCDIYNNKNNGINIIQDTVETTVDNCRIYNNGNGITIADDSLYTTVIHSTIYDNDNYGIYLSHSTQNTITNNYFINNGIYVQYGDNNVIDNNKVNGKPLVYLEGESDTVIDVDAGQVILVNCDNITIQNQEISNTDVGINLRNTHNCLISGNTITSNNGYGIIAYTSNSNTFTDNDISNNENGIKLDFSTNNNINGNKINSNIGNGIHLKYSSSNTIISNNLSINNYGIYIDDSTQNTITNNSFIKDGIYVNANKNVIDNNTVNGKPLVYLEGESDTVIDVDAGQIILVNCDNIKIQNQKISNTDVGIKLWKTNNCLISGNTITSNNNYGIFLTESSNKNIIYHNNFINNYENAYDECNNIWNDSKYGNYWSDYKEKYPNARKKPFKGIWDTPYDIEGGSNNDSCPLIEQWPKSRTRTIPRNRVAFNLLFQRCIDRFPIIENFFHFIFKF